MDRSSTIGFVDKHQVLRFQQALNEDPEFFLASRRMSKDILLRVGGDRCFVKIRSGKVAEMVVVNASEFDLASSDLSIGASEEIWRGLLRAIPAPGYIDLVPAAAWFGLELSGDVDLQSIYRHAIARLVGVLREVHSGETPVFKPRRLPAEGTIEPVVGKYVYVTLADITYRVYFEEGGNPDGIPLICQHTAGADCRQWRYLLNDPVVASRFRIIAHDLPYHGKSLPPETIEWWKQEYKLDASMGQDFPIALMRALKITRPIYMGASIGGMIASDLPWKHPGVFRAVIACEVGEYMPDWEAMIPTLSDPKCRASTTDMGYCQAPGIPLQNTHENTWVNDSTSFGVHAGDVEYYAHVHDLRDKIHLFDTATTSVYFMNGEYDLATPPNLSEALAAKIKGAKAVALIGLGHFPHCEDYDLFKTYLHPVLEEIAAKPDV